MEARFTEGQLDAARNRVRAALYAADNANHQGEVVVMAMASVGELTEALRETRTELVILRCNIADAEITQPRWAGMTDCVRDWIARIDAALSKATGQSTESGAP
jgi:hypothetical protein